MNCFCFVHYLEKVLIVVVCAPVWRKSSVWDAEVSDVRRTDSQTRPQTEASESHSWRRAGQERSANPDSSLTKHHNRLFHKMVFELISFTVLILATKQNKNKSGKKSVFDKELTNTSKKALKQYRAGFVLLIFYEGNFVRTLEFLKNLVLLSNDDGLFCLDLHLRTESDSAFRTRRVDASNPKPSKIFDFFLYSWLSVLKNGTTSFSTFGQKYVLCF